MIVVDTNVLSETLKPQPSDVVLRWFDKQDRSLVFTTTISLAEVLCGLEMLPIGKRRTNLTMAVEKMFAEQFEGRILPFDETAARAYARIGARRIEAGRPFEPCDTMIGAIAQTHGAAVATRDTGGFEHCGITIINPWEQ